MTDTAQPVVTEGAPAPNISSPENPIPADFKQMLYYDVVESSYYRKEGRPTDFAHRGCNDALANFAPRDAQEGMTASLLIQLYNAASEYCRLAAQSSHSRPYKDLETATKLTRAYTSLLDAFNQSRGKGTSKQEITVQYVNVADGGRAVIGDVNRPTEGG